MTSILFIDPVAYKPYSCNTLRTEALGGSEASMLRICRALAAEGLDVSLYQAIDDQREMETIEGIRHVGMDSPFPTPKIVVHFRTCREMPVWESIYPKARHIMWTQDVATPDVAHEAEGKEIVCLTQWHRDQFAGVCSQHGVKPKAIYTIFNPVEVDAERQPKVKGRLGFFSSPHKGLKQVRSVLDTINQSRAESLHLVIANPGYIPDEHHRGLNITNLGQLPHHRVMEEMSRCEVLFYPQTVFPETFGIVLAEANAMGTPVLAHDMGAASEVLGTMEDANQVVDCTNEAAVKEALEYILSGCQGAQVSADPRFSIEAVTKAWKEYLRV